MNLVILISIALNFTFTGVSAHPPMMSLNGKDVVKKVKERYEKLESLKANFEQEYVWELAGETQTLTGTLYLRSGDNYRIETDTQVIVTDGKTVWTYSKENDQVIIDWLRSSEENPLPKDLLFKYSEEYQPHFVGEEKIYGRKAYVLNLVPKEEEAFIKSMKIWVDASLWLTVKIQQVDINDNINTYRVKNIQQNIELDPSLFTFKISPETEVVDLR
ncbi:outer membrane lipoprotein chaperone LolA [candidate division KSB1 bacterium]|nr:outer membrane lipoprotein chaperone LolA [candidate division KSB1 bacterium]NIR69380.1 outer membrane lipoprotein chaperone LolA [candidate division KSB1 bacterium]NIS24198.1 outer membrane lipoprotein chaperone LolA [candidate division KSB1 bacterium]NIT71113.1 outer membrane lipoprotein chaperone LolA [candidate division KSB1 bacterium]NIU24817.1 outer membrane lipoprotein chaperone LolA [candidate division KSB1 bacterium]